MTLDVELNPDGAMVGPLAPPCHNLDSDGRWEAGVMSGLAYVADVNEDI